MNRWKPYLALLIIPALLLVLLITSGSWLIARKVIALLMLPVGFLWIVGLGAALWPGLKWRLRITLLSVWCLYSLAGNAYVGIALLRPLEKPYLPFEEVTGRFDALVLLGGGTTRSPGGIPALGARGDRVIRPAVLYLSGQVGVLIATGRSITEIGEDRLLSRETSQIWQSLGVPKEDIVELSEPRNTAEELAEVARLLADHPGWKCVGLCSSASHLNRAMKEAESQGLELIPVPSDFRSDALAYSSHYVIPQSRGFRDVQTALWEYLGALF